MDSHTQTIVIAICGKKGAGKTSIAAVMTKILMSDKDSKILVIDIDPAGGLSKALGIKTPRAFNYTREEQIQIVPSSLEYKIINTMVQKSNMSFLALSDFQFDEGLSKFNTFFKEIITDLASNFQYVIIDGEPEIEAIKEKVIENVTHLVLVSDVSPNGINFVQTINEAKEELMDYEAVGLILNRLRKKEELSKVNLIKEIPLLTYTIDDDELKDFDISKNSMLDLPEGNLIQYVRRALSILNV